MSRFRVAILVGVVVAFAAAGAYLIFHNTGSGGGKVTVNLTVTAAKSMQPNAPSVHQNDTVTINITSDMDGEVHMHGYDIVFETKAGQVVSHTFKADNTGKFLIEWESTSAELGNLFVNP